MDDKLYYSRTGYVSNSILDYIRYSARAFKKALDGQTESIDKPYLRFGQIVHLRVLEEKEYKDNVLVFDYLSPKSAQQKFFIEQLSSYKGVLTDEQIISCYKNSYVTKESDTIVLGKGKKLAKTFANYLKYLLLKDIKTVISSKEKESVDEMDSNARDHKVAKDILFDPPHPIEIPGVDSYNETEVLWQWKNVKCKSLIDRYVIDHNTKTIHLIDFKTTAKIHDFQTSFYEFKYDRQLVFYREALKYKYASLIADGYTIKMSIVACDTKTHEVRVFRIEEEDVFGAIEEFNDLMTQADYHISTDQWDHTMAYYTGDGYERL